MRTQPALPLRSTPHDATRLFVRVGIGIGVACVALASGCVSTGSVHASLGKRGIEASRLETPATASATQRGTVETSSFRVARVGTGGE